MCLAVINVGNILYNYQLIYYVLRVSTPSYVIRTEMFQ